MSGAEAQPLEEGEQSGLGEPRQMPEGSRESWDQEFTRGRFTHSSES